MEQEIYDIAIVGAGPAGLTAALYALRARKTVLILEKNAVGGQILPAQKISNYPALPDVSGQAFADALKSQVKSLGGVIALEEVVSVTNDIVRPHLSRPASRNNDILEKTRLKPTFFQITTDEALHLSRSLILATGSAERRLNLPGERELIGRGLSYCATCDGAFFSERSVGVYGGGSSALSSALYLADIAEKVYLIHRSARFRAEEKLLEAVESDPRIAILHNSPIVRLKGSSALEAIVVKNTTNDTEQLLPLSALFVNIGRVPDTAPFSRFVTLTPDGYVSSNETCTTSVPGVFCAGDARKKPLNQLVTATSDGAVAASAAVSYLNALAAENTEKLP